MNKTSPQKGRTTPNKNITVEFPGVKIKISTEKLTLESLEEMVFEIVQKIGQKAMVEALKEYDEKLRKARPRGEFKNTHKKGKYLQTRVGSIWYRRTKYKDKSGKARYLLDEKLKMRKNQRMSLKLSQIFGTLASMEAYRGVSEQVSKLLGIRYSHEAIRQNVIKEGKRIEEMEEKELEKVKLLDYRLPKEISEVLYTEIDATYIRKQNRGGKRERRKKRHFEVKLGLNYTGKEDRYESAGEKKSKQLKNKSIYVGIKPNRNKFLENLSYISERDYGLSEVERNYFGGDGDTWIRTGQKNYFPRAKYLLCLYHLFERLRRALPRRKEKQKSLKVLFEENRISDALDEIQKIKDETQDVKEYELISEYYTYVENNRDGIEASIRIKKNEEEHSAGAVESNIDKTIAHRFKKRGMSWSEDGASALLKIRQMIFNGEWDDWWYKKRDQRIEVKSIFKEPLTGKQACMKQDVMPYVEATLPCYRGPDQNKPWVRVLTELSRVNILRDKVR